MKQLEYTIVIVMITIACAVGLAMGLADRGNKLEKQLDRIESKISSANT